MRWGTGGFGVRSFSIRFCSSSLAGERQEHRPSKLQLALLFSSEIGNWLAFVTIIGSEQDQFALDDVLCLEPELGWPALVRAQRSLRHNTLKAHGAGLLEQNGAVSLVMVIELDSSPWVTLNECAKLPAAVTKVPGADQCHRE